MSIFLEISFISKKMAQKKIFQFTGFCKEFKGRNTVHDYGNEVIDMGNITYTLDTVPLRRFHKKIFAYTLGGTFMDGYIIGTLSLGLPFIVTEMNMSVFWQGLIGSSALIGILIGAPICGWLSDKIGRQIIYLWHFIILVVAAALQFFVQSPETLFLLRLILGFSIGAEYVVGPTMLAEFVPLKYRATMCSAMIAAWYVGNFVAFAICYLIKDLGPDNWRWMLVSAVVPGILVLFLRAGSPESLRWLIKKGKIDKAREIVVKFLGPDVSIEGFVEEARSGQKKVSFFQIFGKKLWKRTLFGSIFYASQVLVFYAVFTFLPTVLSTLNVNNAYFGSVIVNFISLVGGVIGLLVVDRFKRREFIIATFILFGSPLVILGIFLHLPGVVVTVLFCMAMAFLAMGQTLQFVYPPEMFPTELRSSGVGFVTAFSRVGAATGTFLLPVMLSTVGVSAAILMIAGVAGIGLLASIFFAPETRGKSLEDTLE
ncbi:MAG TPA: MFS transporter [Clostridiales bacterium]|nr:MFS transporter [Clostridiales bacterium]